MAKAATKSEFYSMPPGPDLPMRSLVFVMGMVAVAAILVAIIDPARFWLAILGDFAVNVALGVPLTARLMRRRLQIGIGDDGVRLAEEGARKFFPIDTLESCSVVEIFEIAEGLDLVRRDGSSEKIVFPSVRRNDLGHDEPARGACEAIEASIARFRALARSRHDRADLRLARHGETTLQWVTSLRRTEQVPASYRNGAPSPDDVLAVLDDPAAPPAMRVAAAIAIEGTPAQREHVREAAERTADPRLAAALRVVLADAAPEKLAEALDGLEARDTSARAP